MSDALVDGLVVAAQKEMKQYREDAYDKIKGEVRLLGTVLTLTDGTSVRHKGLSLLERLTEPILTDIAVEIVRTIVKAHPNSAVTATQMWLETLPLDRSRLEKKTGLDRRGIERVLSAMFKMIRTSESENVAELDGIRVRLLPEPSRSKETNPPGTETISNEQAKRARTGTGDRGRSQRDRRNTGAKVDGERSGRKAATEETTPPPFSSTLGNRRRG
jgi:hypothetical protein